MKITPLFDNVLIEPKPRQTQTSAGIYLPDNSKQQAQEGTIRAIGEGALLPDGKTGPMKVKVGDIVHYKSWGQEEIKIKNQNLLLVSQKDIMSIIEE